MNESPQAQGRRPIVGMVAQTVPPIPGQAPLSFAMGQQYVRALAAAGAAPWIIPLLTDDEATLRDLFNRLDGLFLGGGVDIDPAHYGEAKREYCGAGDPDRDAVELMLLRWAAERRLPVLGVCRGVQMINVAHGGTLFQDIAKEHGDAEKHDYFVAQGFSDRSMVAHTVRVAPGTRLGRIVGESVAANSMHHQGIKRVGEGLVPVAFAPDGVIEGIESANGRFVIGVQWHPEELVPADAAMKTLFEAFVGAAASYRAADRGPVG